LDIVVFISIFAPAIEYSMLAFNYYIENNKDRAWFDSSNIIYAECIESDTQFKDVIITFNGGRRYLYKDVYVYDWRSFKEANSQGEAINTYIINKKYSYQKIDNINAEDLFDELEFRKKDGITIQVNDNNIILFDNKDNQLYQMNCIDNINIENNIKEILELIGKTVRIIKLENQNGK
jgi:hypothetical protein